MDLQAPHDSHLLAALTQEQYELFTIPHAQRFNPATGHGITWIETKWLNSRQNWPETAETMLKSFCHENNFYSYKSKLTAHNKMMDDVLLHLTTLFDPEEWIRNPAAHRNKLKEKVKSKLPRIRDEDPRNAAIAKVQEILDKVSDNCYEDILRVVIRKVGAARASDVLTSLE